jgi:type I site-specific restriction-modification system R (restriction) subunit
MAERDLPVTAGELREQLNAALQDYATKDDLKDLRAATKEDLKDLRAAMKEDLKDLRASLDEDLRRYATKDDLLAVRDELRTHFDAVTERFTDEFRYLHDWVDANTNGLAVRVGALETGHGARLLSLETRVTSLESQRRRS